MYVNSQCHGKKEKAWLTERSLIKGHATDPILPPKVLQGNDTDVIVGRHLCSKRVLC